MIVIIFDLAIEALEAFGHVDFAGHRNRLDRTGMLAEMARTAAFGPPLQQINQMQPAGERQDAAERA